MWEKSEPWDAAAVVMAVNFNAQRVLRCQGPEKPSGVDWSVARGCVTEASKALLSAAR